MNIEYKTIKPIACINGLELKMIAIITMLIDHIGAVLFPQNLIFRYIGRIAFPIFVFLLVEGLFHTKNIRKYECRMLIFACISEIPFDLAFNGSILEFSSQNVFFTLALGLIMLDLIHRRKRGIPFEILMLVIFFAAANLLATDYSGGGILLIWWFYEMRSRPVWKYTGLGIISFLFFGLIECWSLLAVIPLLLYNGKRGFQTGTGIYSGQIRGIAANIVKYLFYVFYPAHLLILALINTMVH